MNLQWGRCYLLVFLSGFLWVGCASAPPAQETIRGPHVERVSGNVEFSSDGAEWRNAYEGQAIQEGDRLRTGEASEARVALGEEQGGWVEVLPGSVVLFEQLSPASENSEVGVILNLPQGRVVGDTAQTRAGRKILVKTPNGMHEVTADGR